MISNLIHNYDHFDEHKFMDIKSWYLYLISYVVRHGWSDRVRLDLDIFSIYVIQMNHITW